MMRFHKIKTHTQSDSRHRGHTLKDGRTGLYLPEYFNEVVSLEKRRCERSKARVVLMLADLSAFAESEERLSVVKQMMEVLSDITRETDIKGWYSGDLVLGVLFTELNTDREDGIPAFSPRHVANKCLGRLASRLGVERFSLIDVTWEVYPDVFPKFAAGDPDEHDKGPLDGTGKKQIGKRAELATKRLIDVVGSIGALVLFGPVLAAIAIWIKLSSEGPVFFKQERIGLAGKTFMLFKFRSMYVNNDPSIHKEFVKNLISGGNGTTQDSNSTYKITNDPRVTSVGRILRKTSLDELPQFINVLKGDMSLVGPRPPIMYECEDYDLWHRHRVLDMKPGITGLWQVTGRSVTTFDEMVRMDIRYIREWSLWLDIRIILKTPIVMLMGDGAY